MKDEVTCIRCLQKVKLVQNEKGYITKGTCKDGQKHIFSISEMIDL